MKAEKSKKKIMAPVVALLATAIILAVAMAGTAQAALDKRSNVYEANIQHQSRCCADREWAGAFG